jgi:phage terminase small subunit
MPRLASIRQERFAQAYVACGVAAKAYREAGYEGKAAFVNGHEVLTNPNVRARIAEIRQQNEAKAEFTRQEAIRHMAEIARYGERDSDRIAALDKIGRWCGWNQPTKVVVRADPLTAYLQEITSVPLLR